MFFKITQLYTYYSQQWWLKQEYQAQWYLKYLTTVITIGSLYYETFMSCYESTKQYVTQQSYQSYVDRIKSWGLYGLDIATNIGYKIFYKIPYDLGMTYVGVVESYVDEYKLENNNQLPTWYWFPYFYVASIWYMLYCSKTVFNNKMKEIYSDKQLKQCVENHNNEYLKVNYEWHGIQYCVVVKIDKFVMRDLVRATTKLNDKPEISVDCTKQISQLLGPSEDWHRVQYTPQMLGYNNLQLYKLDNDTYELVEMNFDANDILPSIKSIKMKVE